MAEINYNPEEIKYEDEQAGVTAKKTEKWNGLTLVYEFLPGDCRFENRVLSVGYGFIQSVLGNDDMSLDCYIGSYLDAPEIYRVTQLKPDKTFDEYKFMIGFEGMDNARAAYLQNMPEDWFGGITISGFWEIDLIRKKGKKFYIDNVLNDLKKIALEISDKEQNLEIKTENTSTEIIKSITDSHVLLSPEEEASTEMSITNILSSIFGKYLEEARKNRNVNEVLEKVEESIEPEETEKPIELEKSEEIDGCHNDSTKLAFKELSDKLEEKFNEVKTEFQKTLSQSIQEIQDIVKTNSYLDKKASENLKELGLEPKDKESTKVGCKKQSEITNKEFVYFDCLDVTLDSEDLKLLTDSKVRAKILVTQADIQNLNRREYTSESLRLAVEAIQPYIKDGLVIGYEEHPEPVFNANGEAVGFNATQNPPLFRVIKMWFENGKVYAIAEFFDNSKGNIYAEKIKNKETVSVSLRALGECSIVNGKKRCDIDRIDGFDIVQTPAMHSAKVISHETIGDNLENRSNIKDTEQINKNLINTKGLFSIEHISCLDCDKQLSDKLKDSSIINEKITIKEEKDKEIDSIRTESPKLLTKSDDLYDYKASINIKSNYTENNKKIKYKLEETIEDSLVIEEILKKLEELEELKHSINCYLAGKQDQIIEVAEMIQMEEKAEMEEPSEMPGMSEMPEMSDAKPNDEQITKTETDVKDEVKSEEKPEAVTESTIKAETDMVKPETDMVKPETDEKAKESAPIETAKEVEDSKEKQEELLTEMCGKDKKKTDDVQDSTSKGIKVQIETKFNEQALEQINDKINELLSKLESVKNLKETEKDKIQTDNIVDKEENLSKENINNKIKTDNLENEKSIMDALKEQEKQAAMLARLEKMLADQDAKQQIDNTRKAISDLVTDSIDANSIPGINLSVLSENQKTLIKNEVIKDSETVEEARKLLKTTAKLLVDKELEVKQNQRLAGLKSANGLMGRTVETVTDSKAWMEYFEKIDKAVDNSRSEYRRNKITNIDQYSQANKYFTDKILSDWDAAHSGELAKADKEQRTALKDGWITDAAVVVSNADFKNQPIIARVIIKQLFQRLTTMQLVQGLGPGKGEGSPGQGGGPFGAEFKFPYWYYTEPTHNPKRHVSDNGPIPETTSGIGFESFYARLRAIGFSVPVNLRKQLEEGALGIDPVALMLEAISDDLARAIDTHLLEEHQQTCDEYQAVAITAETPQAAAAVFAPGGSTAIPYDGGTVTYGTTVTAVVGAKPTTAAAGGIPIVKERPQFFLNSNGTTNSSTIDNNIIVTFPNTNTVLVRGVLDASNNIVKEDPNDATPNYAVDYERGYFVFNASSGIAANGDLANTRFNYSYVTNYVNFDLDIAANTLAEDYYNGLLNLMSREAGIMCMHPRFVRPNMFLLPSSIAQGAIGISSLFHNRKSPVETYLNQGFAVSDILGAHNNINIMQTNGRMFAGDRRGILFERYMVGYGVQTPAALDGPHNNMYAPSGGGNVQLTPGHKWALHVRDVVGTPLARDVNNAIQNHPGRTIRFLGTLGV